MDKQAFKQRMQLLKTYRDENPGKGYLEWKLSLPSNLLDDRDYNLERAYELGYKPEMNEDGYYHLPTRDLETGEILKKPWHPTFLIGLLEDAKLGYYPQTKDGVTRTTTWEGNENPKYKLYASGGEVRPKVKTRQEVMSAGRTADGNIDTNLVRQAVHNDAKEFANRWYPERFKQDKYKALAPGNELQNMLDRINTATYDMSGQTIVDDAAKQIKQQLPNARDIDVNKTAYANTIGKRTTQGATLTDLNTFWVRRPNDFGATAHEGIGHIGGDANPALMKAVPYVPSRSTGLEDDRYRLYLEKPNERNAQTWDFRYLNRGLQDDSGNNYIDPNRLLVPLDVQLMRTKGAIIPQAWEGNTDEDIVKLHNTIAANTTKNKDGIMTASKGGEVPPTRPNIPDEPIRYKGKLIKDKYGREHTEDLYYDYLLNGTDEISKFDGLPLSRGLKPVVDIEDAANMTPLGDVVSVKDMYTSAKNLDWTGLGLAAATLIPFVPLTVKLFRRNYKGITPKIKTASSASREIPKVDKNYAQNRIDLYIKDAEELKLKAQQIKTKANNQTYNIAERLSDDPSYLERAREVKELFGDDYVTQYADIIDAYNTDPTKLPRASVENMRADINGSMALYADGTYDYRVNINNGDLDHYLTEHEYGHYTDFKRNKDRPDPLGDSNMFYLMSKDIIPEPKGSKPYFSLPSELKSHMTQLREYMFDNGYIGTRGLKVSSLKIKKALEEVSKINDMNSVYKASKLFKNIDKYTKWFNSIPLLGVGALGVYNKNNKE